WMLDTRYSHKKDEGRRISEHEFKVSGFKFEQGPEVEV
ncbi:unnamed protein product, partial [marine sediment metagenome]